MADLSTSDMPFSVLAGKGNGGNKGGRISVKQTQAPTSKMSTPLETKSLALSIPKPKHPLTAYNLFFKAERAKIVGIDPSKGGSVLFKRDKRHKKTHGKISFSSMGKEIARRWKSLDSESKAVYQAEAAKYSLRYKQEMAIFKQAILDDAISRAEEEERSLGESEAFVDAGQEEAKEECGRMVTEEFHRSTLRKALDLVDNELFEPLPADSKVDTGEIKNLLQDLLSLDQGIYPLCIFSNGCIPDTVHGDYSNPDYDHPSSRSIKRKVAVDSHVHSPSNGIFNGDYSTAEKSAVPMNEWGGGDFEAFDFPDICDYLHAVSWPSGKRIKTL